MTARKTRTSRVTRKPRAKTVTRRPAQKPARRAARPKLKSKAKGKARAKKPARKPVRTAARRRTVTLGPHTVDRTHGSQGFHPKPAPVFSAVPTALHHAATVRHH